MKQAFAMLAALLFSVLANAGTIRVSYDEWCPYACLDEQSQAPRPDNPGYFATVLETIYGPLGHEVEFVIRPWERALEETRRGDLDAVLAPSRSEAPELVFPEEEIGMLGWCFYTRSDESWEYTGVSSLRERTLGVLVGNNFGEEVTAYVEAHRDDPMRVQEVTGLDFLEQNLRKLLAHRIDTMLDEPATTDYLLFSRELGGMVRKAGCLDSQKMFIAFSPENPRSKEYAQVFSEGMRQLHSDGRLEDILTAYGLHDWR